MRAPHRGSTDTVQLDHSYVDTRAIEADIRAKSAKGRSVRTFPALRVDRCLAIEQRAPCPSRPKDRA